VGNSRLRRPASGSHARRHALSLDRYAGHSQRNRPAYKGIAALRKKGDQFQYGGPRLLVDKFLTPDGKGHFTAIGLPEEKVPDGCFLLATRRGKQFNSMIHGETDPLTGAARDAILMSQEDATNLGLRDGDPVLLRNDRGEFRGRVKIDRIKPGCLQGYWPEVNVLVPAGCLDPSGVPDYNAVVEIVAAGKSLEPELAAAAASRA
jgi:anaerobic selenocysteine-containing dehydrogenase